MSALSTDRLTPENAALLVDRQTGLANGVADQSIAEFRTAVTALAQAAGVVPITWVAVAAELQADWRRPTGQRLAQVMGENLPFYGNLIASHMSSSRAAARV